MRIFGRFTDEQGLEAYFEYAVICGVAEWMHMYTRERLPGSPIFVSNQLEGMGWFLREYRHRGGRIILECKLV